MLFKDFDLTPEVLDGLRDVGFETATPVQQQCIPLILQGKDILATAQTGTGKTAAFAVPVLNHIFKSRKEGIQALILTPTRELAKQIDEHFWSIGYHTALTTATVYGGDDWSRQSKALHKGVNVIVATPGRLLDQMKVKTIDFTQIDFLILDEADRMLDMGFLPDVKSILRALPEKRQNLMFSATMPPKIKDLVKEMMHEPAIIALATSKPAEGITQMVYNVDEADKMPLVLHLFEEQKWTSAIVFTSTKRNADVLARELHKRGASVTSIHGDRSQEEREAALEAFRKGDFKIIVATDVISRGIDIDNVSHVINYSVPREVEDYVHRIGRTARAQTEGDAITLVSGSDRRFMAAIYKELGENIRKMDMPDFKGRKPEWQNYRDEKSNTDGEGQSRQSENKPDYKRNTQQHRGRPARSGSSDRRPLNPQESNPDEQNDSKEAVRETESRPRNTGRNNRNPRSSQRDDRSERHSEKRDNEGRRQSPQPRKNPRRNDDNSVKTERKPVDHATKMKNNRLDIVGKVQAPNMAKIEKAGEKTPKEKKGVWGLVKKIFGS